MRLAQAHPNYYSNVYVSCMYVPYMTVLKPGPNKRRGYLSQSRNTRRGSNYRRVPLTPTHHVELISYTPCIILCTGKHRVRNVKAKSTTLKLRQSSMRRRLAARYFTVDAKRIREWCSQKEQLVEGNSSSPMTGVHTAS